jgi:RNA polymerase sigma-70 factor (ECF subfamily)
MDGPSFTAEIERQRGYLLRVAVLQLRDRDLAEDVVQDTLLAALTGQAGFTGKSTVKTWLTGILKHKIVDAIRRKQRDPVLEASLPEEMDLEEFDGFFRENGSWQEKPADWGDPESSLGRKEFFDVMQFCLDKLPANTGRVFMMREVMDLDTDEIWKELRITANNLWVILYRARMALRQCLEQHWFGQAQAR